MNELLSKLASLFSAHTNTLELSSAYQLPPQAFFVNRENKKKKKNHV